MVHLVGEAGAHLQVHDVSVRGGGPDLLHHGRHKVVSLKLLGAELCAALRAAHRAVASPPVPGDTGFAKVVHAGQHNRLLKQVTADDTCQVFSQAASGRCGTSSSSSSHDEGQSPLEVSPQGGSESKTLKGQKNSKLKCDTMKRPSYYRATTSCSA